MSVKEMVTAAHEQARKSGFWDVEVYQLSHDDIRSMAVAQKLALISTEVMEFETAEYEIGGTSMLEELADVVIRTFDLAGYLEITLPEFFADGRARLHSTRSATALHLYRQVAHAVQSHRKGRHDLGLHFQTICLACQDYATSYSEDCYALRRAVEAKMLVNEGREHKHGAAY